MPKAKEHTIERKKGSGNRFHPSFIDLAARIMSSGKDEGDLATALGVKPSTIVKWRERFPAFDDAITKPDEALINGLIETAIKYAEGFEYDEVTRYYINKAPMDSKEEHLVLERKVVKTKSVPADNNLLKFLLVNKANFKTSNDESTHKSVSVNIGSSTVDNFVKKIEEFEDSSKKRRVVINEYEDTGRHS